MLARQHRLLAGSLVGGVVVLVVAMWFALGTTPGALDTPPLPLLVAPLVLGGVVHVVLEAVGYRAPPLDPALPADDSRNAALARFQSGTIVRFAICEAVAIVSIAAGFVVPQGGYVVLLVGCAVTLALLGVHVWPWRRPVDRAATVLERDGARSGLRETFGFGSGGVVREL